LPPERVVSLLVQTCEALAEAHAIGLVHRDIKPGNIFAAQRGGVYDVAKLLDFGLAKPLARVTDVALTQEGTLTGSPLFMAPEQATGDTDPDGRSDIYSLGAVAYFLLTGRPPFEGDNAIRVLMAHATEQVVPPSQIRPDIPADLERVVLRCLEKYPNQRFATSQELAAALEACECYGRWTRQHARAWWQSNGGVEDHQPSCEAALSPAGAVVA
jgi:serine/threonine-protein kinase